VNIQPTKNKFEPFHKKNTNSIKIIKSVVKKNFN
jgi:hypothetical protein